MMSFLMEAVVIAFTLGAVIGGVVAIHLVQPGRKAGGLTGRSEQALEP